MRNNSKICARHLRPYYRMVKRMKNEQTINQYRKGVFLTMLGLSIAILVTGTLFLINGLAIQDATEQRTRNWLLDVSDQIASLVDSRISQSMESMNIIRDSAVLLNEESLPEFLTRKASVSGFDELYLAANVQDAENWIAEHSTDLAGDDVVHPGTTQLIMSREPELGIYYSSGDTVDDPVLLGVKNAGLLTSMLSTQSFNGEGTSRVITRDGELLAAADSGPMSTLLRDAWEYGTEEDRAQFSQMYNDIHAGKPGVTKVEKGNEAVLVSYIPLLANDWYVLTIIPADLLGKTIDPLITENLWLTLLLGIIFGCVLIVITLLRRRYQASLEYMAFVDPLTGGMSDARFRFDAEALLAKSSNYTLVSVDMQGFKLINNIYGIEEGNRTLCYLYNTLKSCLHTGELITRASADLFYLLLEGQNKVEIEQRLQDMYKKANAFNIDLENPYYLELRFGADVAQSGEIDVPLMEERSSTARKTGNKMHGACTFYDSEWQRIQLEEKDLVNWLDNSMRAGDFQVYYQPKVRLEDRRVCGAEALIRWQHPKRGMIPPGVFIPVLEKYRFVTRADLFVFEQVCKDIARWKQDGKEMCVVSVNLSRQNLDVPDFLEKYQAIRDKYKVDRGLIEFELTETILLDDPQGVRHLIDQMHEAGFGCSLDDFGSGYSSLGLINQLNVDTIKLDRSFFVGDNDSSRGRSVVESIMKMAGKLHINTVAEGVESMEQVRHLRHAACDTVQGYVFFRPMPVKEFENTAWENGRLFCVDSQGTLLSPLASEWKNDKKCGSIVTFHYRPDTGNIRFSSVFSPMMEGRQEFPDAITFLHTSGILNENDEDDFLNMLGRCARKEVPWAEGTVRICVSDGGYEWMELHLQRIELEEGAVIEGVLVNTARWRNELDRWKEQANRDGLTGLYNRTYFERTVHERLTKGKLTRGALIFIDVDDFKKANDALGHMVGDDILRCIAQRILGVFRHSDVVARYGGDEFVVFVSNVTREVLETRLERLCTMFRNPYRNGDIHYQVMGSIGASLFPEHGGSYETLLANADAALYDAKRRGKNQYRIFQMDGPEAKTR